MVAEAAASAVAADSQVYGSVSTAMATKRIRTWVVMVDVIIIIGQLFVFGTGEQKEESDSARGCLQHVDGDCDRNEGDVKASRRSINAR